MPLMKSRKARVLALEAVVEALGDAVHVERLARARPATPVMSGVSSSSSAKARCLSFWMQRVAGLRWLCKVCSRRAAGLPGSRLTHCQTWVVLRRVDVDDDVLVARLVDLPLDLARGSCGRDARRRRPARRRRRPCRACRRRPSRRIVCALDREIQQLRPCALSQPSSSTNRCGSRTSCR